MTEFLVAAVALLFLMIPLGAFAARATLMEAVVAYEAFSALVVMVFILLPEGFNRPSEFEFPVIFSVLLIGSGLVFVRSLEHWL